MSRNKQIMVSKLHLDLSNYRTVKQRDEKHAIHAMISINPDRFWALMESIIDEGYHPTENIIVQKDARKRCIVKEGNRRIASLKIVLGLVKGVDIPEHLTNKINGLNKVWQDANKSVPCAIYSSAESGMVDKIVALIHAKGEKAARDAWTAVAKARYDRDKKGISTPGLDLLELYLKKGKNLSADQAERWAGDYPLTVLDEAIQKLVPILDFSSLKDLVSSYPQKHKKCMDQLLYDIGVSHLTFNKIRDKDHFFGIDYGISPPAPGSQPPAAPGNPPTVPPPGGGGKIIATPLNDPKSVKRILRSFKPKGKGRDKVATLLVEIRKLKIEAHPYAFCFLLRSMFEISAKAYCADHKASGGPDPIDKKGKDKQLAVLLGEIINHLTGNGADKPKQKLLHGASVEINKSHRVLSVNSMNQLIHHQSFSVQPGDICSSFNNVYPLLEEMNK